MAARFGCGRAPRKAPDHQVERVAEVLRIEEEAGLHQVDGYLQLRPRTEAVRHELLRFLLDRRAEGKRVVGYGAPGKGNTLLNYCGIRSDLLEYTVDRNPYKHGRFTPGTRIPDPRSGPDRQGPARRRAGTALEPRDRADRAACLHRRVGWRARVPLPTLHTADLAPAQSGRG